MSNRRSIFSLETHVSIVLGALTFTLIIALPGFARDTFFADPEGLGMAGSRTASVDDFSAQYYNPAGFGFFNRSGTKDGLDRRLLGEKSLGFKTSFGAGYRVNGNMGTFLDDLSDVDPDELDDGLDNTEDVKNLVRVTRSLRDIDDPGNALQASWSAELGGYWNNWALGVRSDSQVSARVSDADLSNVGLVDTTSVEREIQRSGASDDDSIKLLSDSTEDDLRDAGLSTDSIEKIDFQAREANLSSSEANRGADVLETVIGNTGDADASNDLEENETEIRVEGAMITKIPLSYGRALSDHFAVGANLNFINGRVYGQEISVFQEDSSDVLDTAEDAYETSSNVGVDVGAMARFSMFQIGVMGRNLNSPEFDGPTVDGTEFDDVTLDPQGRIGVAFIPTSYFLIEADYDVTMNETALEDYDTQNVSVGAELKPFQEFALRGGVYENQSEDDIGLVYTAGVGLGLWGVSIDAGVALSEDTTEIDTGDDSLEEVPHEGRASLSVNMEF